MSANTSDQIEGEGITESDEAKKIQDKEILESEGVFDRGPVSASTPAQKWGIIQENSKQHFGALIKVVNLNPEERNKIIDAATEEWKRYLKVISDYAKGTLEEITDKARTTFTLISCLNIITFSLGIVLIGIALYVGLTAKDQTFFSAFFGGAGFATITSSFLLGAMQRSQKFVSDLANTELAMINYFQQMALWSEYIAYGSEDPKAQLVVIKEAANAMNSCTKDMIDLLEKYVQPAKG